MSDCIPLRMPDSAVPARMHVAGVILMTFERTIRIAAGMMEHTNALATMPMDPAMLENVRPVIMATEAPRAAPSDTPVV